MNFGPYANWCDGYPGDAAVAIVCREHLYEYGDGVFRTVTLGDTEVARYKILDENGKTWKLITYHAREAVYERGEFPTDL